MADEPYPQGNGLWQALSDADRCSASPNISASQRADALLRSAGIRVLLGDYFGAEENLRRVSLLRPGDAEAAYRLAQVMRDRPQEAITYADHAVLLAATPRKRLDAYRLAGEIRLDLGDNVGAQKNLVRALELSGEDLEILRVMVRLKRDRPQEAALYAERAVEAAEKVPLWIRPAAHRLCARIWMEIKDYSKAMASLKRAINLNGNYLDALEGMIQIKHENPKEPVLLGQWTSRGDARLDENIGLQEPILHALKTNPDDLESLRKIIAIKHRENRFDEAGLFADRFVDAVRRAPAWQHADAYRLITRIFIELGNAAGAKKTLKHALDLDPKSLASLQMAYRVAALHADELPEGKSDVAAGRSADAYLRLKWNGRNPTSAASGPGPVDAYILLAQAREKLGDEAGAEMSLKEALDLVDNNQQVLEMLIQMKLRQHQPAQALAYCDRLLKVSEKNSPTRRADDYLLKARVQLILKDEVGAETSLKKALDLVAGNRQALELLFKMKLAQRRPASALAYSDMLINASGNDPLPQRADAYWQRAQLQLQLKDEAGAERSLKKTLEIIPAHLEAIKMLIQIKIAQRQPHEALGYADLLVGVSEKYLLMQQADNYLRIGQLQLELKDEEGAERSLKRALELDPSHSVSLQLLVQMKLAQNRLNEALFYADLLVRVSEKAPLLQKAAVYWQRAKLRFDLKDEVGAEESLKQTLETDPAHGPALEMLVQMKLAQRRPGQALVYSDSMVTVSEKKSSSQQADAYRRRAQIRLELQDYAGAQEDFERVLELVPEDMETLWTILAGKRKKSQEALALVESYRPASPRLHAPWLILRGMARLMMNDRYGAQKDFDGAVMIDSAAVCFADIFQKHRDALDPLFFDLCLERFPNNSILYSDRGVARYQLGRQEGAVADFKKSLELRPAYLEAYLSLAWALAAQGHFAEAMRQTDKAIDLAKEREGQIYDQLLALRSSLRETNKEVPLPPGSPIKNKNVYIERHGLNFNSESSIFNSSASVSMFGDADRLIERVIAQLPAISRCIDSGEPLPSPAPLSSPELEWINDCRRKYPLDRQNALQKRLNSFNVPDRTRSKECEKVLMQLDNYASAFEECVSAKHKQSLNIPALSGYHEMYSDCQKSTSLEYLLSQEKISITSAIFYFACLAVDANDVALCQGLGARGDEHGKEYQRSCLHRYEESRIFRAIVASSSEAGRMCDSLCAQVPTWVRHPTLKRPSFITSEFCRKECSLMFARPYAPGGICAKTAQFFSSPAEAAKSCEEDHFLPDFYSMDLALAGDCSKVHLIWQKETCRNYSGFKKAFERGDVGFCGDNPLCRSMMGGGASPCEVYLEREKAPICRSEAGRKFQAVENDKRLKNELKARRSFETCGQAAVEVDASLRKMIVAVNDVLIGTPGREERLKELRHLKSSVKKYIHRAAP